MVGASAFEELLTLGESAAQAVEAMLQCFCEDCERNNGSAMHPYYMPPAFKQVILEAAKKKTGSRLAGAARQIGHAINHVLQRAAEPIQTFFIRLTARLSQLARPGGYHSVD